jgi:hypothetical protein
MVAIDAARTFGMHGILFHENAQAIAEIEACIQNNRCFAEDTP